MLLGLKQIGVLCFTDAEYEAQQSSALSKATQQDPGSLSINQKAGFLCFGTELW